MLTPQKTLNTKAVFGEKPEPATVLGDIDLTSKLAIVTGGYSGIGFETARALAERHADIIIPVRTKEKAEKAIAALPDKLQARITLASMDLADINSVRKFTQDMTDQNRPLDLLINNAGIMACPETRIGPGWEAQFGVNHLGHFELTGGLLSLLRKADSARIVCLSSIAHRRSDIQWDDIHFTNTPYEKWDAYGQAKTANALFALSLDMQLQGEGIRAFSVHPGGIMTPLQRHLENEEMVALGWIDKNGDLSSFAKPYFKTPTQGAATSLWAATSPELADKGGVYCEDCDIAEPMSKTSAFCGVASHGASAQSAEKLWQLSLDMLA